MAVLDRSGPVATQQANAFSPSFIFDFFPLPFNFLKWLLLVQSLTLLAAKSVK